MPSPDRGEVWLTDLGIAAKVRPCLVLSVPPEPQDRVLVTLVPHTTSVQGTRFVERTRDEAPGQRAKRGQLLGVEEVPRPARLGRCGDEREEARARH